MKKTLLFALALVAVGCADVQAQNLSTDDAYNDVTNALVAYGSVAQVCEHRQFLDLKTTLIQFLEFQNGKLHGPYENYFSHGQLQEKGTYKDGERHGLRDRIL